eukprot:13673696-Heterocapsa_arctica.AAC.1
MGLEDKHRLGFRNDQKNHGEDQQHMAGEEQDNEGTNEVQHTQEQQLMDEGDFTVPQIAGEHNEDDEPKTTDCPE